MTVVVLGTRSRVVLVTVVFLSFVWRSQTPNGGSVSLFLDDRQSGIRFRPPPAHQTGDTDITEKQKAAGAQEPKTELECSNDVYRGRSYCVRTLPNGFRTAIPSRRAVPHLHRPFARPEEFPHWRWLICRKAAWPRAADKRARGKRAQRLCRSNTGYSNAIGGTKNKPKIRRAPDRSTTVSGTVCKR